MHIYNWYHSNVSGIHYVHEYRFSIYGAIPLLFIPLAESPLLPFWTPFTYLETLLAVTGSVHLSLRLLVNWPPLSQPFPQSLPPPNSQNPGYQAPHYDDLKIPASSVRNKACYMSTVLFPVYSSSINSAFFFLSLQACHFFYVLVVRCFFAMICCSFFVFILLCRPSEDSLQ
jgi:hypothetical protein